MIMAKNDFDKNSFLFEKTRYTKRIISKNIINAKHMDILGFTPANTI